MERGSAERSEQVVARLLAAAAHLGANTAVLVVLGVALALFATGAACHDARLNRCANNADVRCGLAGHDAAGGLAQVGAVETKANAAHQLLQVALAEVGIGATRTRGGAVDAGLNTAHHHIAIAAGWLRMRLEHLSNRHFSSFRRRGGETEDDYRVQSGYSSLRQAWHSSGSGFGVRARRNEWYGATKS